GLDTPNSHRSTRSLGPAHSPEPRSAQEGAEHSSNNRCRNNLCRNNHCCIRRVPASPTPQAAKSMRVSLISNISLLRSRCPRGETRFETLILLTIFKIRVHVPTTACAVIPSRNDLAPRRDAFDRDQCGAGDRENRDWYCRTFDCRGVGRYR